MRHFAFVLLWAPAVAWSQTGTSDFSGTWELDEARSRVNLDATLAGLIGAGAPPMLHLTHPANGTLVLESPINESHARLYVPGKETTTPIFLGEAGTITTTAKWEAHTLVSEGVRESPSGDPTRVRETYSLSAGGETLEVEITVSGANGSSTSTSHLRYTRIQDVGPCESWPSPCKDFSSLQRN